MRSLRRMAFAVALLAPVLCAQNGGAVVGSVINGISGAGVAGMNVLLWTKGEQYQATTDDSGTFRIEEIVPGSYRARFEKDGFAPLQRDKDPIIVAAVAAPVRIRIEMTPYAMLRGRVLDPDGNPAARVEVAIRPPQSNYALVTAKTESDGSFVFDRLTAGSYYLLATPEESSRHPAPDTNRIVTVPTYFPSAVERVQAEKILVKGGVESSGYEIRLRAVPVYRLSGTVVDESGNPAARAEVRLVSTVEGMSAPPGFNDPDAITFGTMKRDSELGAIVGQDGRFDLSSVLPGPWWLVATYESHRVAEDKAVEERGAVSVTVADHDIGELQIRVAPAVALEGTAEFHGVNPPGSARAGGLLLMTADGQGSVIAVSRQDGTLRVLNLIPGPYRFLALPGPRFAFSPVSVLLGDREVLGQVVELTAPAPPLRVFFNANTGSIRGTVEKGECAVIALLANPPVPPMAGRTQPCKGGEAFEFLGLPSGDYYALAFDRVDPRTPPDASVLTNLLPNATRVSVGSGPAPLVQLPITHLPE